MNNPPVSLQVRPSWICKSLCAGLALAAAALASAQAPDPALTPQIMRFADLKVFGVSGLPLRQAQDKWEQALRVAASDPAWRTWVTDKKNFMSLWIVTYQDHAEWVGGMRGEYVDPQTGNPLTWRADNPPPASTVDPGKKLHGAWVSIFRSTQAARMVEAARLYRLTGEEKYAEWAAQQLDFYAENYLKWVPLNRLGYTRLDGSTLEEAIDAYNYVYTAVTLGAYVSQARHSQWQSALFMPMADNLERSYNGLNNISAWQRSSMAMIALWAADEALMTRALQGDRGLLALLAKGVTADSIWYEGSLSYNNFVIAALAPLYNLAGMVGRGGFLQAQQIATQNMLLAPLMLRFPDGYLPNPSDGTRASTPDVNLFSLARRSLPTTVGVDAALKARNWDLLLDPPEPLDRSVRLPEVKSVSLPASRMALLKKDGWQVFTYYGQLTNYHAQEEALTYELYYGRVPISYDIGKGAEYSTAMQQGYYPRAAAQNVPVARDMGQFGWNPGVLDSFDPDGMVAVGQPQYRPDASASRRLRIDQGKFEDTVQVVDRRADATGASVGTVLNLSCQTQFGAGANRVAGAPGFPSVSGFQYWKNVEAATATGKAVLDANCAGTPFRITIAIAGNFQIFRGRVPDSWTATPDKMRDAIYVRIPAKSAQIVTTIEPQ